MSERSVTDVGGRMWTCVSKSTVAEGEGEPQGKDVTITCSTPSVPDAVSIRIGWQWATMAPNGLAQIITRSSPVPKR